MNALVTPALDHPRCPVCGGPCCHDVRSVVESALVELDLAYRSQRQEDDITVVSGLSEHDARRLAEDVHDHGYEAIAAPNIEDRWCVLAAEVGVLHFGESESEGDVEWRQGDAERRVS